MLVPDRRRRLLAHLRAHGSAQIDELATAVGVSASTVRRDLALLEAEGHLQRAHGGAYVQRAGERLATRMSAAPYGVEAAKARIGGAAAELVVDGMTIMILAGSTTASMLSHLAARAITVVTNGLEIAHTVAGFPQHEVIVLGGILHREQMTLLGPMTAHNMSDLHVDVLFAGAYGVDGELGVTGAKVNQAGYHHSMLRHTESLVVLADGGKLGRQGPTLLAGVEQVDTFVTDTSAPDTVVAQLRERGAEVIVC